MHGNTTPIKLRISIRKIGRRGVSKLPVHSNFFKLMIQRIRFSEIVRIPKLSNEVSSTYQEAFPILVVRTVHRRKSCTLNPTPNPVSIEQFTLGNVLLDKQHRSVDVVGHERRVG